MFNIIILFSFIFISNVNANLIWDNHSTMLFTINSYNNSDCLNTSINKKEVLLFCANSVIFNGYPTCCYNELSIVSTPLKNTLFDTCYDITINNTNYFINYGCNIIDDNIIDVMELFSFIGICLIIIIFIWCLFTAGYKLVNKSKHGGYDTIK